MMEQAVQATMVGWCDWGTAFQGTEVPPRHPIGTAHRPMRVLFAVMPRFGVPGEKVKAWPLAMAA